jgi:hypothetical protein
MGPRNRVMHAVAAMHVPWNPSGTTSIFRELRDYSGSVGGWNCRSGGYCARAELIAASRSLVFRMDSHSVATEPPRKVGGVDVQRSLASPSADPR